MKNEVECMSLMDSEFIVRKCGSYKNDQCVYLLLEPCFGSSGDSGNFSEGEFGIPFGIVRGS